MYSDSLIGKHLAIKIGLWLLVIFMMVALFGWDLLSDMKRLRLEANIVERSNHKSHDLHAIEVSINRYIDPVKEFLITGDYRLEAYFYQLDKSLRSSIEVYESDYGDHALTAVLGQLDSMKQLSYKILNLPFAVGNMEGPIILQEVNNRAAIAERQLSKQHQKLDARVNHAMHMMNGLRMDVHDDALMLLIVLLITLLLLTHFIYSQIVLPLVRMRKVVQGVGSGDFTQQCIVTSNDEIGELASAFNAMGYALVERDKNLDQARSLAAYQEKVNALGLIAAGIAHEIGNPLAAISISLQLAKKKIGHQDKNGITEQITAAFKETARIESIIQIILNFARHEPNQTMSFFHLQAVIENAVYLSQMSPDKKSIHVGVNVSETLPKIYSDEGIVLQVLINLILNAIDACEGGNNVRIHAFESSDAVMIHVQDTGCGIPLEEQFNIFKPHFTSKPRGKGTGLGLAISRELVDSINGTLKLIASDSSGSCFQICLPLRAES